MDRRSLVPRVVIVLACAALLALSLGAGVGPSTVVGDEDNVTPPHVHPDEQVEDGDLAAIQAWLGGYLGDQLGQSAVQVSEEEYDLAREYVGEEFLERFGDYASVNRETDDDGDEETFREARDRQEGMIDLVEEFEALKEDYEAAVRAGDDEEARRLARELLDLAQVIDVTSAELLEYFGRIDEQYADMDDSIASVEAVRENVSNDSDAIAAAQFDDTELSIAVDDAAISFLDPMTGSGTLMTADGEPVTNETATLRIGEGTRTIETDASGAFTFEYRPVTEPAGETTLVIAFVPEPESAYHESETTTTVDISPVEATVVVDTAPGDLAFGDSIDIEGTVTAGGVGVNGLPIEVNLGNRHIETATTDGGDLVVNPVMPAAVEDGERTVRLRSTDTDTAVNIAPVDIPVIVRETATTLDLDAGVEDGAIVLQGQLATDEGLPVANETITIAVGDDETTTVTGDGGTFAAAVAAPDGEEVTVMAGFDGTGSNLAPAEASRIVPLPVTDDEDSAWFTALPPMGLAVLVGATSVVLVLGIAALRRGQPARLLGGDGGGRSPPEDRDQASTNEPTTPAPASGAVHLERARERLAAGDSEEAVVFGYAAVRRSLGDPPDDALTHWEFFDRHRRHDGAAGEAALRAVTEGFERTVFAEGGVDEPTTFVKRAESLCRG